MYNIIHPVIKTCAPPPSIYPVALLNRSQVRARAKGGKIATYKFLAKKHTLWERPVYPARQTIVAPGILNGFPSQEN